MGNVEVVLTYRDDAGWAPVVYLAEMAARTLGAALVPVEDRLASRLHRAVNVMPRLRSRHTRCLVIAPTPAHLNAVLRVHRPPFRPSRLVGWVIDSFWHDQIPAVARYGIYDAIFVTDEQDLGEWRTKCPTTQVRVLPWGTDALTIKPHRKSTDIVRIGRCPKAWDDDGLNARAAAALGISYRGRPPFLRDPLESLALVRGAMSDAKVVLAFSNRTARADYTHPALDYVTARWTDGLAAGATIAGTRPTSPTARALLWPGSTIDVSPVSVNEGMIAIRDYLSTWNLSVAQSHHALARESLDWRHSLSAVASELGLTAPVLRAELAMVSSSPIG